MKVSFKKAHRGFFDLRFGLIDLSIRLFVTVLSQVNEVGMVGKISRQSNSFAILSFVLRLIGVILCFIYADVVILLGLSAIILASIAQEKPGKSVKKRHGFEISELVQGVIVVAGISFRYMVYPNWSI